MVHRSQSQKCYRVAKAHRLPVGILEQDAVTLLPCSVTSCISIHRELLSGESVSKMTTLEEDVTGKTMDSAAGMRTHNLAETRSISRTKCLQLEEGET